LKSNLAGGTCRWRPLGVTGLSRKQSTVIRRAGQENETGIDHAFLSGALRSSVIRVAQRGLDCHIDIELLGVTMTFLFPELLWLLVILPALAAAYVLLLRRRKKYAVRHPNVALLREALGAGSTVRRHIPPLLFLLGLAASLLAAARPAAKVTLPFRYDTVILALDISRSMAADDVKPTRLAATQEAVRTFIAGQPAHTRIGLVTFASTASLVQPPTDDSEAVLAAVNGLELQNSTAIGTAILVSLEAIFPNLKFNLRTASAQSVLEPARSAEEERGFKPVPPGSYKSAVIVLLSDGSATTGLDPIEASHIAADHGVRIFTVGVGTPNGRVTLSGGAEIRVVLDEDTLKDIAAITKGQYFYAGTAPDLTEIYNKLAVNFSAEKKNEEISALFAAIAALLLISAGISSALSTKI
jgi:Ca-activated chloride channel family protein